MTKAQTAIVLVIALSCVGVVADAVLKLASSQREVILSKWLFVGVGLSCVFAIGWVFLMRVMKLATAGVIYGVTSAVLLCLIGVIFFGENSPPSNARALQRQHSPSFSSATLQRNTCRRELGRALMRVRVFKHANHGVRVQNEARFDSRSFA
jgi:multidrug transporter EmrE-like cation transporter